MNADLFHHRIIISPADNDVFIAHIPDGEFWKRILRKREETNTATKKREGQEFFHNGITKKG